ncbi:MAG: transposase [Nitrospira sp.]|nr:transposase [Nitrospira sp.]
MSRHTAVTVTKRNESVVQRIRTLKAEHPFWGYRRIWAHLRFVDGLLINKKRVLRLMRAHALLVKPNHRLKATRTLGRSNGGAST